MIPRKRGIKMCENRKSWGRIFDKNGCLYYRCNNLSLCYKRREGALREGGIILEGKVLLDCVLEG